MDASRWLTERYRSRRAWQWGIDLAGFLLVVLPAPGLVRQLAPPDRAPAAMGLWGAYMASDGQPPAPGFEVFPTLRRRGNVALVGLSTGVPKPPLLATGTLGDEQIARTGRVLSRRDPPGAPAGCRYRWPGCAPIRRHGRARG